LRWAEAGAYNPWTESFGAGLRGIRETLHLLDNDDEQDWIEKYRAALVQPTASRRSRLVAALNTLARTLGFAIGKTSGKLATTVQSPVVSSQLPEGEVQEQLRGDGNSGQQSASKKSSPPEHQRDKKAS
jgi:hypothetical protein